MDMSQGCNVNEQVSFQLVQREIQNQESSSLSKDPTSDSLENASKEIITSNEQIDAVQEQVTHSEKCCINTEFSNSAMDISTYAKTDAQSSTGQASEALETSEINKVFTIDSKEDVLNKRKVLGQPHLPVQENLQNLERCEINTNCISDSTMDFSSPTRTLNEHNYAVQNESQNTQKCPSSKDLGSALDAVNASVTLNQSSGLVLEGSLDIEKCQNGEGLTYDSTMSDPSCIKALNEHHISNNRTSAETVINDVNNHTCNDILSSQDNIRVSGDSKSQNTANTDCCKQFDVSQIEDINANLPFRNVSNLSLIKEEEAMEQDNFVPSMLQAVKSVEHSVKVVGSSSESESSEDDDSSDESSDSSDSSSIVSEENKKNVAVQEMPHDEPTQKQKIQTKKFENLFLEPDPEIPETDNIELPTDAKLEVIGQISGLIESSVVVIKACQGKPALNLDSVLFLEDRSVLGQIYETFGPVSLPFYVVCFKNGTPPEQLSAGQDVYFAPDVKELTSYVLAAQLRSLKGSDASWQNDKEPPPDVLDYSDDEQERNAKMKKKAAKQSDNASDELPERGKRMRGRGRGNWTNRSVRYVNPTPQMEDSQMGWMNAVANMNARRMGPNLMPFRAPPPPFAPVYGHALPPPPPPYPPGFNPMFNGPRQNFYQMTSGPPPSSMPPPPPPPLEAGYLNEPQGRDSMAHLHSLPLTNLFCYNHPPPIETTPDLSTITSDPKSSSL